MIFISTYDGTPCELKGSRTVWSGGKPGDSIKGLPIAIRGLDILQRQRRDVCDRPRRRGRRPATYCAPISWEEATPSDLVFYPEDSHVGIVGGWDEDGTCWSFIAPAILTMWSSQGQMALRRRPGQSIMSCRAIQEQENGSFSHPSLLLNFS